MVGIHYAKGALLVEQLIGTAVCNITADAVLAIMDHCQVKQEALRRTLDAFMSHLPLTGVPRFSEVEHLYGHDGIQRAFTDDGEGGGRLIPARLYHIKKNRASLYTYPISFLDAVRISLTHPSREQTTRLFDMYFAAIKGLSNQTPWELHTQNTTCEEVFDQLLLGNYYLHDGFAGMAECIQTGWRAKTTGVAAVTVLAILAYKAQEGRLPESLEQLVGAGLLREVPMDPYSGGPLVYKVTGDKFTLHSVAEDFTDDQGVDFGLDGWSIGDHIFWPVQYPVAEEDMEGEQS